MKLFIKRIIPKAVWEAVRGVYVYIRRLYLDVVQTATYSSPKEWMIMFSLVRSIRPKFSMVPVTRLRSLYELSKKINLGNISGDIVECGVYNGGSAAMMARPQLRSTFERKIWLFDSFEGFPPPTENDGQYERDYYYKGWCEGSVDNVKMIFNKLKLPQDNLRIVKGWFEDTFPEESPKISEIAILHIDADWYESVKICLETFYPKLSSGGYVVFDDYTAFSGCKKAVHEYLDAHNISVELETDDGLARYFKKP